MNTIGLLIKQQFTEWRRTKLLYIFAAAITCLWGFCLYTGLLGYQETLALREKASVENRNQWLGQDKKHPHVAAHFGNFAFKHLNPLSIFDNGTDAFTGTYVYMEAHRQNDVLFSPAQSASSLVRFGSFNIALLLQIILPLFLIILTFNSILAERTGGTLAFLKSSGILSRQIVEAKILAPLLLVGGMVVGLYVFSVLVLLLNKISFTGEDVLKSAGIILFYLAYYFIVITLGVYVSAVTKSVKQSLVILLGTWVFACILLPKLLGNIAVELYPLPSNTAFKEAIMKDVANGIDGHNTSDKRAKAFTQKLLKKYGVDSTNQLPVNIEGLMMIEGERYSSKVFNGHFNLLGQILLHQQRVFAYASLVDPLLGIKNLSMGLSNTDYFNDQAFRKKAEAYRMNFVQTMNLDMALHSKEDGFMTYKIGRELFQTIPDFSFRPQNFRQSLENYLPESICLLILTALAVLAINRIAHKL